MISVRRYNESDKSQWNQFNEESKTPLFMFDRNYMDYHKDRFIDHSLLFFDENELIALLPMCQNKDTLVSHGGLTYGGFITNSKMKQHIMNDCFDALIWYARQNGIKNIRYKTIPHIYHLQPAEEDRYALYSHNGKLVTIDASTYVNLQCPLKMLKGRKAQVSRAKREGVAVKVMNDINAYSKFIDMENEVLLQRHNTYAVHTAAELKLLHDRFPNNIHLFASCKNDSIIAGTIVFEYDNVIHTQYMAANQEARQIGALDLAIYTVMEKYKTNKKWLDFGISTEHDRIYLNEGLISQKEGFGGRTGVYEIWELIM